jgi:hypothetical protein
MGYRMTHSLGKGLIASLSFSRPGEYMVHNAAGKFITYARTLKAAKEFAKNYVVPVAAG